MYANNELMFPAYVIPLLRDQRGSDWQKLVDRVAALDETHPESLAFSLMMIRIDGCMECETDSFRAMRGCAMCAIQTLRRSKVQDKELMRRYRQALADVREYFSRARAARAA